MTAKKFKNPSDVHAPFSSYSHCVEVTNPSTFLFCSGQIPATQDGRILARDSFSAQGELVIKNLKATLSNSGAQLTDIVRLVTYLSRKEDVAELRELLNRHFPVNPPANSVSIVQSLTHQDILIELEATAVM
jgi:2-iminobutanoate/2-iminopropanoate deaminase